MANIQVTTSGDLIRVNFNDYWIKSGSGKGAYDFSQIGVLKTKVDSFALDETFIKVQMVDAQELFVSNVEDLSNEIMQIDTVNGIAPTNLTDLFDKLTAILE